MPPLRTHDEDIGPATARPTRDPALSAAPAPVATAAGPDGTARHDPALGPGTGLTPEQRERISAELARQQIGDALERQLFLAALDYQVNALAIRLSGGGADATTLLAAACADAAAKLDARTAAQAQRVCLGFVGELAGAFDACFETTPTPEPQGPFMRVLSLVREVLALPLALEAERLRPVIAARPAPAPRTGHRNPASQLSTGT